MGYNPHGHYELWVEGTTLFAKVSGSWNMECAQEFEKEFMALAQHFSGGWGHIVCLNDWELGTLEVSEVIERLVEWCIVNGLERAANVYQPSALKHAVINKMIVSEQDGFVRAAFDNLQDAADWLTEEGFPTAIE
ncbi:hypothetical protein ACMXYW_04695 [Neptuniibacter sp. QD48_55]|uniref:hypothetical protein n=2 Tax=unclassified Neptuniibacter TaxID=2630693 RepID=UPI0039F64364